MPRIDDVITKHKSEEEVFVKSANQVSQSIDNISELFEKVTLQIKQRLQIIKREVAIKSQNTYLQQAVKLKTAMEEHILRVAKLTDNHGSHDLSKVVREFLNLTTSLQKYEMEINDLLLDGNDSKSISLCAKNDLVHLCRAMLRHDASSVKIASLDNTTEELKCGDGNNQICFAVNSLELEHSSLLPISVINARSGNTRKKEQCSFSDVVLISNTVVAVDRQRLKVKRFNFNQKLIDWVRIASPYGLTTLPATDEVMVTQPGEKSLTRVSTSTGLRVVSTSRVDYPYYVIRTVDDTSLVASTIAAPCDRISFDSDEAKVVLSMNTHFHLIRTDGQLLKVMRLTNTTYEALHGTMLLPDFESFTVYANDRIAIRLVDMAYNNFVGMFTCGGRLLWMYPTPKTVRGLTSRAGAVHVYVGDEKKQLLILTEEGQAEKVLDLEGYFGRGNIIHAGDRALAVVDFSNVIWLYPLP